MVTEIKMLESNIVKAKAIKIREFLRMCGFLVGYETVEDSLTRLSFTVRTNTMECCNIDLDDVQKKKNDELIDDLLLGFESNNLFSDEEEKNILKKLKDIYCNHDLAVQFYNTYHFHRIMEIMQEAHTAMLAAFSDLFQIKKECEEQENPYLYYIVYARGFIAKKVNEIGLLYGWGKRFHTSVLVEELESVLERVNNISCGYYLLGQLTFVDSSKRYMSSHYFEQARKTGLSDYFESNVFYYMAANIQSINQNQGDEDAIKYHQKAVEKNNYCYRSLYKLGIFYIQNRQYELAIEMFEKIIMCVSGKKEFLQPLEIMYLFKAYQHESKALEEMKDQSLKSVELRKNATDLLTDSQVGKEFFSEFYMENAERYLDHLRNYMLTLSILECV